MWITELTLLWLRGETDIINIINLSDMFEGLQEFNGDMSAQNTSNVNDTEGMFCDACAFNRDLSRWNVSNVKDMSSMFSGATKFNGDVSAWNTSNVNGMGYMFIQMECIKCRIHELDVFWCN